MNSITHTVKYMHCRSRTECNVIIKSIHCKNLIVMKIKCIINVSMQGRSSSVSWLPGNPPH